MKTITVFTPSYNRAHLLPRLYNSLCKQTCKDFAWLIIDDGSTDGTKTLVETWIKDNKIEINYIFQDNQGMHGAHNTAYQNIKTVLNTCVDSDDYMTDDAVQLILEKWQAVDQTKYAGIIGLDSLEDGSILGTSFTTEKTTLEDFYLNGGKGDKKLVYRTDIVNLYPEYPLFSGENYVGLGYKYLLIDKDYELLTMNKILIIVEYQDTGSSRNMYAQYVRNPKGFAFIRKQAMIYSKSRKRRFEETIHYVSSSLIAKDIYFIKNAPKKLLTVFAIPFGILLYGFIKFKTRKSF